MAARVDRLVALVIVTVVVTVLLPTAGAWACSCAMQTPEEALAQAPAAFVGQLVERRPEGQVFGEPAFRWTFAVDQVMVGDLAPRVDVVAAEDNGANCGLRVAEGATVGLVLYPGDAGWGASSCSTYEGPALLAAGEPHPPDPGLAVTPETETTSGAWLPLAATVLAAAALLAAVAVVATRRRGTTG